MKELVIETFKSKIGNKVLIFLKNSFRYEGILLGIDGNSVQINDKKSGTMIIALDEISTIRSDTNERRYTGSV